MPSLREMQQDFAASLVSGRGAQAAAHVVAGAFPAAQRLRIYRNNVLTSLTNALGDVYPVVARLVGEGFFRHAAHAYIGRHPSRSGNLHEFGAAFPEFLRGFAPARRLPYLGDVARLEWAWHESFHAPEHPPLDLARLAAVPDSEHENLRFTLHSAARLVASPYPMLRIWEVNQDGYAGESEVSLDAGGEQVLVARPELEVMVHRLAAGEFAFLRALSERQTLGGAYSAAVAVEADFDLARCLQRHIADATLVGVGPA
jgi:hypothetical protein